MEKKNRIVLFVHSAFTKRDYDRYGVELLLNEGFNYEVWDFTKLLYPNIYFPYDYIKFDCLIEIESKAIALKLLNSLNEYDIVLNNLRVNRHTLYVFKHITKNKILYGKSFIGGIPSCIEEKKRNKIKNKLRLISNPDNLKDYVFNKIIKKFHYIKPYDFIIVGGEKTKKTKVNNLFANNTEVINAGAFDYNFFLKEREKKNNNNKYQYIAYIDTYFPYHPDFKRSGKDYSFYANEWRAKLLYFFNWIEDISKLKIIIAAHPKSHYEKYKGYFESRKIIKGDTLEIIKNSEFCITTNSTATNFTIFFNKPVLFITTKIYENIFRGLDASPYVFANSFGTDPIFIDEKLDIDLKKYLHLNYRARADYMNDYIIKDGTPEMNSWLIFAKFLKEKLN